MSLPVVRRFIKRVEERALGTKVRALLAGPHGVHGIKGRWVCGLGLAGGLAGWRAGAGDEGESLLEYGVAWHARARQGTTLRIEGWLDWGW